MAQQREIPQEQWAAFFARLNNDYQGADVTLELIAPDDQPQLLVVGQPLADISCEEAITLRLDDGVTHVVEHATAIQTEGDAAGLGLVVLIQAAGASPARLTLARGTQRAVGGTVVGGAATDPADPGFVGGSAGASGGAAANPQGGEAPGVGDDYGPLITFGRSDDMGGVSGIGGGSLGDQDLSGRRSYDITADVYGGGAEELLDDAGESGGHAGPGSETAFSGAAPNSYAQGGNAPQMGHHRPDIIDGGSGQGVIDPTMDPIEGPQIDPANDASDPYVEGEVGAQAERDLDELLPDHPELRRPDDGEDERARR
jgi:hypothetical protein